VSSQAEVSKLPGRRPVSVAAAVVALAQRREQAAAGREERLGAQRAVLAHAHPLAQQPLSRSMARPSKWGLERPARAQPPERQPVQPV
jgi:hypothetical protein